MLMRLLASNRLGCRYSLGFLFVIWWHNLFATVPLPPSLIDLNSPRGTLLFARSEYENNFLKLASQFVTQKNQAYCGVASSVMVLNALSALSALSASAPVDATYKPYHYFTQDDFFTAKVRQIVNPYEVGKRGITLDKLGRTLKTFPIRVIVFHANGITYRQFHKELTEATQNPNTQVIINFLRTSLHQQGNGHFSPIAAYNEKSDRFLILDVARYKYPPFWVRARDLWKAINTLDSENSKTRGFIVIKRVYKNNE